MTRDKNVRVDSKDLSVLKVAKDEFDTDVPLGFVARQGALKIIEENGDEVNL